MEIAIQADGRSILVDLCEERTFSSGSRGYFLGGKATIDGKRYQASLNLTEIGSKPGSEPVKLVPAKAVRS